MNILKSLGYTLIFSVIVTGINANQQENQARLAQLYKKQKDVAEFFILCGAGVIIGNTVILLRDTTADIESHFNVFCLASVLMSISYFCSNKIIKNAEQLELINPLDIKNIKKELHRVLKPLHILKNRRGVISLQDNVGTMRNIQRP